jgi:predicted nucleic acid-binding protein
MSHLIDTDWLIDALRGVQSATEMLEQRAADGIAVSIVTYGELYEGAFLFPEPQEHLTSMRQFLSGYRIYGLSDPIMGRFAQTRSTLRRQGNRIADFDILIASTALVHDLTLVTRNVRHFQRIPELRLVS